jgi:hypothetical protein
MMLPLLASERSSAWLERQLWELDVAGSNPVAPTIFQPQDGRGLRWRSDVGAGPEQRPASCGSSPLNRAKTRYSRKARQARKGPSRLPSPLACSASCGSVGFHHEHCWNAGQLR